MMLTRAEMKQKAKEQLNGNLGLLILCGIIYAAISVACSMIPLVGVVGTFVVTPPLLVGLMMVLLEISKGNKPEVGTMFTPFNTCFGNSIVANLLVGIFTVLWTLLLIIPGIIKTYSYSMTFYILAEHPEMTGKEAITESRIIMDGHKWDLFVLELSFILWILLSMVTCGIALIYVLPYMNLTMTNFYNSIKRQPTVTADNFSTF